MKIKSTAQLFGVGLGTALGSLALMSTPAFSATLTQFAGDENAFLQEICTKANLSDCNNNATIENTLRIAEIQGRAARDNVQSLFLGPKGSNTIPSNALDSKILNWVNGKNYFWTLTWTPSSPSDGIATFSVFDDSTKTNELTALTYEYIGDFNTFNALGLITRADDGFASTMNLSVDSYTVDNGSSTPTSISLSSQSNNSQSSFQKAFFLLEDNPGEISSSNITQLTGTFAMNWTGNKPITANVGFAIRLYDPDDGDDAVTTPEPTTILGLLGVGTLGLVGRKRKIETK